MCAHWLSLPRHMASVWRNRNNKTKGHGDQMHDGCCDRGVAEEKADRWGLPAASADFGPIDELRNMAMIHGGRPRRCRSLHFLPNWTGRIKPTLNSRRDRGYPLAIWQT